MGRLYVKKAEITTGMEQKLNFIKAAALLHGAQIRFQMHLRDEVKAKDACDTLRQMESNLLISCDGKLSGAHTLIEISLNVKRAFKFLRQIEESELEKLEIIPENIPEADANKKQQEKIGYVQCMMKKNTSNFKCLMSYVAQKCLDILGKPPCHFAIAGLGSLARREITLYSDFEHVIVLDEEVQDWAEYESVKEYFRWFAVVFEIMIVGLGETIIPSVGVKSINDLYASDKTKNWFYDTITPSGVSIDGMMPHACKTPLGRQELTEKKEHVLELILPVSKMSSLLTSVEDLKNGYNLKDVLRQSCFVFGCEALFCYFRQQALNVLSFEDDKDGWNSVPVPNITIGNVLYPDRGIIFQLGPHEVDSKSSYYRPLSALLSYIGRTVKFYEPSSFEIISSCSRCIPGTSQHEMSWAFAVACELRIKIYARGRGNRLRVGDQHFFRFVGESCFRNCVRQVYYLSCTGREPIELTPLSLQDFQTNQEVHALMTAGCYKEAQEILRKQIEELENFCVDRQNADRLLNQRKLMLANCCVREAVISQKREKAKLFEEAKKLIKSFEGTEFENDCWNLLFQIYRYEGQKHDAFDTVVKLLEREGDSAFTKFSISCIHFGKLIATKFPCPSSAVDFCDEALGKYKGFHSQVAFRYGKAFAVTRPGMDEGDSKEFHDLAEEGRKEFRDLSVVMQNRIRDMSKNDVLEYFDVIFIVQMSYKWWEDALAAMKSSEIIRKSNYQDHDSTKFTLIFCAGSPAKYLLKSKLEKDSATKYELFRKGFQSFGDSNNFFACKGSFYYHLNVRTMHLLLYIDVETSLLLKYSRELKPRGLDNIEKCSSLMGQLFLLLVFYEIKMKHGKIFDVADDLLDVLDKFCSFLYHPLFANALYAIRTASHVQTWNLSSRFGPSNEYTCRLVILGKKLDRIFKKVRFNLEWAGESSSKKQYHEAIELWFRSDFKGCIHSFWRIINSEKTDFYIWTRSVAMF